jgi:hypothetical protein
LVAAVVKQCSDTVVYRIYGLFMLGPVLWHPLSHGWSWCFGSNGYGDVEICNVSSIETLWPLMLSPART